MSDLIGRRVRYSCFYPGCNPTDHPGGSAVDTGTVVDRLSSIGQWLIRWDSDGRTLPDVVPDHEPQQYTIELIDE
jgi:hypothetical protein